MMRTTVGFKPRFLAALVIAGVFFTATVVSYRGTNSDRALSPFAAIFQPDAPDCTAFCWHDIRVGETTLEEAEALVRSDPAFTGAERVYNHDVLVWETVNPPHFTVNAYTSAASADTPISFLTVQTMSETSFTVADALLTWGVPAGLDVLLCSGADSSHGEIKIYFDGSIRINVEQLGLFDYAHATDSPEIRLQPADPVAFIRFYSPSDRLTSGTGYLPWRGFRAWQRSEAGFTSMCGM